MLSDPTIKAAKPKDKPYKLPDEKVMPLLINPNDSKYFRLKYRFDGKEKVSYWRLSKNDSKTGKKKRDDAIDLLADGIDPNQHKKAVKASRAVTAANSFEIVAREWGQKKETNGMI